MAPVPAEEQQGLASATGQVTTALSDTKTTLLYIYTILNYTFLKLNTKLVQAEKIYFKKCLERDAGNPI